MGVTADIAATPIIIVVIVTVIGLAAFYAWARTKHFGCHYRVSLFSGTGRDGTGRDSSAGYSLIYGTGRNRASYLFYGIALRMNDYYGTGRYLSLDYG